MDSTCSEDSVSDAVSQHRFEDLIPVQSESIADMHTELVGAKDYTERAHCIDVSVQLVPDENDFSAELLPIKSLIHCQDASHLHRVAIVAIQLIRVLCHAYKGDALLTLEEKDRPGTNWITSRSLVNGKMEEGVLINRNVPIYEPKREVIYLAPSAHIKSKFLERSARRFRVENDGNESDLLSVNTHDKNLPSDNLYFLFAKERYRLSQSLLDDSDSKVQVPTTKSEAKVGMEENSKWFFPAEEHILRPDVTLVAKCTPLNHNEQDQNNHGLKILLRFFYVTL